MKTNKSKAFALILSACLLYITTCSFAQFKTEGISNRVSAAAPPVTKGYYSIYNNAEKLNLSAGRLVYANKNAKYDPPEVSAHAPSKGYYSIGKNAEKKRRQMVSQGINFSDNAPARVIQSPMMPEIRKGYYSIGNNAQKLHK